MITIVKSVLHELAEYMADFFSQDSAYCHSKMRRVHSTHRCESHFDGSALSYRQLGENSWTM